MGDEKSIAESIWCYCEGGHEHGCDEDHSCRTKDGAKCFMMIERRYDDEGQQMYTATNYGCLDAETDRSAMQCHADLSPHASPTRILCCDDRDFCNQNLTAQFRYSNDPTPPERGTTNSDYASFLQYFIPSILGVIAIVLVIIICFWYKRKRNTRQWPNKINGVQEALLGTKSGADCFDPYRSYNGSMSAMFDQSSGSGSGAPMLVQRTIARQIQFEKNVGKGRFGEVYMAHWNGEKVAVKVFQTTDEASWKREKEIYQTMMLRHENILCFIAADIGGTGGTTHMLLIAAYHEHGSLHDYLKSNALDYETTCRLASTAAAGLCHLHAEIHGTEGKPGIAHRDIKSKNILVKNGGICVIADFGLAVRHNSKSGTLDIVPNPRQGTIRYMAPEVLNKTINEREFEAYKRADMYAFALVMWEIATRCAGRGHMEPCPYRVPYEGLVPPDPSFETMRNLVCNEERRPPIYQYWLHDVVLAELACRMEECWHGDPFKRLPILNLKKKLDVLSKMAENCTRIVATPSPPPPPSTTFELV